MTANAWLNVINQVRSGADELYDVIGKYSKSHGDAPDGIEALKGRMAALEEQVAKLVKSDPEDTHQADKSKGSLTRNTIASTFSRPEND